MFLFNPTLEYHVEGWKGPLGRRRVAFGSLMQGHCVRVRVHAGPHGHVRMYLHACTWL